jgi:hypothetical protein
MHALDREVFRVHFSMAFQLGAEVATELEQWYRFHLAVQDMHSLLSAHMRHIRTTMAGLSGERQVSQDAFQNALGALIGAHETLAAQLRAAGGLALPPLTNMAAGSPLGPFLLSEPLVRGLHRDTTSLNSAWINPFMNQLGEVIDKLARVLFKSLGGLLALQERIAERWELARTAPPAEAAVPEPPPEPTGV